MFVFAISEVVWITLLAPISVAIVGLLTVITTRLGAIKTTGDQTHRIVNSQKTDAEAYRELLITTLKQAGLHISVDPNPHD